MIIRRAVTASIVSAALISFSGCSIAQELRRDSGSSSNQSQTSPVARAAPGTSAPTSASPIPSASTSASPTVPSAAERKRDLSLKFVKYFESHRGSRMAKARNMTAPGSYADDFVTYAMARTGAETDNGSSFDVSKTRALSKSRYRTCWTEYLGGERYPVCETISDIKINSEGQITDLKNEGWHGEVLIGRNATSDDVTLGVSMSFIAARVTAEGKLAVVFTMVSGDHPVSIGTRTNYVDLDGIQHQITSVAAPQSLRQNAAARIVFFVDEVELGGIVTIELFDSDNTSLRGGVSFKLG